MNENNYYLRSTIGEYLNVLGEKDTRVVLVNADLMVTCRNKSFVEHFPERSFNVGIAEQNMVSFSAGLAHEGYIPYAFSMAPFISMRACEQCRTDVAYGNLNVRLVATYAGCSGGISGATHWGMEDCAIMTAIPNMTVLEPSDPVQARRMLDATLRHDGPIYMRSTIEPVNSIYNEDYEYEIGKASIVRNGDDGAFITSGIATQYATIASDEIRQKSGRNIRVIDMHTLKPIDREVIMDAAKTGTIVVAQDHNIFGGLGSAVASVLVEEGLNIKYKNLGIPDRFSSMAHAPYLYRQFGYDVVGLKSIMLDLI